MGHRCYWPIVSQLSLLLLLLFCFVFLLFHTRFIIALFISVSEFVYKHKLLNFKLIANLMQLIFYSRIFIFTHFFMASMVKNVYFYNMLFLRLNLIFIAPRRETETKCIAM